MHQNSILIHLFFFNFKCLLDDMFCVRLLSELMILPCRNTKNFYSSSATFWFWSVTIWYLKLSIQAQTLKNVLKIWNSLQNICGILLKMYFKIKLFKIYLLQPVPVLCIWKWCTQSQIQKIKLKGCFNTFLPVDSFFLTYK